MPRADPGIYLGGSKILIIPHSCLARNFVKGRLNVTIPWPLAAKKWWVWEKDVLPSG